MNKNHFKCYDCMESVTERVTIATFNALVNLFSLIHSPGLVGIGRHAFLNQNRNHREPSVILCCALSCGHSWVFDSLCKILTWMYMWNSLVGNLRDTENETHISFFWSVLSVRGQVCWRVALWTGVTQQEWWARLETAETLRHPVAIPRCLFAVSWVWFSM